MIQPGVFPVNVAIVTYLSCKLSYITLHYIEDCQVEIYQNFPLKSVFQNTESHVPSQKLTETVCLANLYL